MPELQGRNSQMWVSWCREVESPQRGIEAARWFLGVEEGLETVGVVVGWRWRETVWLSWEAGARQGLHGSSGLAQELRPAGNKDMLVARQ